jgi:hypothetical protein
MVPQQCPPARTAQRSQSLTGIKASALMYMVRMASSRHTFSDTMRSYGEVS